MMEESIGCYGRLRKVVKFGLKEIRVVVWKK